MLFGLPIPPSFVDRLAELGRALGEGSIGILVDDEGQLESLSRFRDITAFGPYINFKIDTGYHRAGLPPTEGDLQELVKRTVQAEKQGLCKIHGVYSHPGHSYAATSPEDGMAYLLEEIERLSEGALVIKHLLAEEKEPRRLIISVGATPSSSSAVNLLGPVTAHNQSSTAQKLRQALQDVLSKGLSVELHAGNYPFLDLQQLYTQASASVFSRDNDTNPLISTKDIAFSLLAEVASTYPKRNPPQALIAAGCLALGREPCPGYKGWGMLSDWKLSPNYSLSRSQPAQKAVPRYSGWEVHKVSQEHGILQASLPGTEMQDILERDDGKEHGKRVEKEVQSCMPFRVGQKVRIWPNHACVAAAGFGFYVVVDSSMGADEDEDKVVDIWVRCRGW